MDLALTIAAIAVALGELLALALLPARASRPAVPGRTPPTAVPDDPNPARSDRTATGSGPFGPGRLRDGWCVMEP